jgi:hypothetical protein
MATSAERMTRTGSAADFRRLTIDLSEDDLRVIAEHGYEGAASATRATVAKGIAHATAGGQFAVMESSEASLALIVRTEVA